MLTYESNYPCRSVYANGLEEITQLDNFQAAAIGLTSDVPLLSPNLSLMRKLLVIWRDRNNFQHLIRPLRTMFVVIVCFVCAWLPAAILALIGQFMPMPTIGPYLKTAVMLIANSYIAFNPIVYVLTDEPFRRQMSRILHRFDTGASRATSGV